MEMNNFVTHFSCLNLNKFIERQMQTASEISILNSSIFYDLGLEFLNTQNIAVTLAISFW